MLYYMQHTHTRTHTRTYTRTHTRTHTRTYTRTHMRTHIHAHTHTRDYRSCSWVSVGTSSIRMLELVNPFLYLKDTLNIIYISIIFIQQMLNMVDNDTDLSNYVSELSNYQSLG